MNLLVQELIILLVIVFLSVSLAFRTKDWYLDQDVINIKVIKPEQISRSMNQPSPDSNNTTP